MFEERKDYVRGLYALSDEVQLEAEAHLHAERKIESLLRRYGRFKKTFLGPFFVGYSAIKDK
jgi:hypothetical protein